MADQHPDWTEDLWFRGQRQEATTSASRYEDYQEWEPPRRQQNYPGMGDEEGSSSEEDDPLSYYLTQGEIEKMW